MKYPQAPWYLKGYAIQTVELLDLERSRRFIPSDLEILSVWPGKTLGGIYIAAYQTGSVLEYNELIVIPGLVNYSGEWGAWISHIYVDNTASLTGGHEIWGLPKEIAKFNWQSNATDANAFCSVTVEKGDRTLCHLSYKQPNFLLPFSLSAPIFSALNSNFLLFKGEFSARLGLIDSQIEIPTESPFASLNLGHPWLTVYCDDLRLVAGEPKIVGTRANAFSY
ncbi:MAG: acetoacetate decarboxylase family protein [Oscillatoriaceae bacterium SKW80]|nr:acetoacetate decarboxylase family protein [Oscillatoriaceae bacterium SKYG93]MCX8120831.1 acetoacetate decarboxylase family protein [Oscillatoriaceae bacterium SKW80]MDW8454172.1 acetoacetate decarboxylase family protein [Oscillatoriaceae cyanobacterium SKYGB_i_bin93]HIK26503.1 acetoacetate decarboxylase family protein [Oscillatoriaceae cyanobacterium M7585_C2015_266]